MHVEKTATRGASEESVPCITMSHFCSRTKVSLSGARGGGDFQGQAMPPEPLRQPREITAQDCMVIKKTEIPKICNDCNPCQSLAFKCPRVASSPHLMDVIMREQK